MIPSTKTASAILFTAIVPVLFAACPFSTTTPPLAALTVVPGLDKGGATPLIFIHGNKAENSTTDKCAGWTSFLDAALLDTTFGSRYTAYLFRHDTSRPIGFNGALNTSADDLGKAIGNEPSLAGKQFGLIAHSRGGLVARAYMNTYQGGHGDRVSILITLGTPHHGSPLAIADWGLSTIDQRHAFNTVAFSNLTYNTADETKIFGQSTATLFNVNRAGSTDLGWDNFMSPERGMPYRKNFYGDYLSGVPALPGPHTLSSNDANAPITSLPNEQLDYDLHPLTPRVGSLKELNGSERFLDKIIAYGGYFKNLKDHNDATGTAAIIAASIGSAIGNDHPGLRFSGLLMGDFESANQTLPLFFANDGLVPLQSALFLAKDISSSELLYKTKKHFILGRSRLVLPLELDDDVLSSRKQVKRHRIYKEFDHVHLRDLVYTQVKADLDEFSPTVPQVPKAGFVISYGQQTATDGQTLNVSVGVGQYPATGITVNGATRSSDPDGTVTKWEWTVDDVIQPATAAATLTLPPLVVGSHTIQLVVTDNQNAKSPPVSATVVVSIANQLPAITSTAPTSATVGQLYSHQVTATGTGTLTYSLTTFPIGMTISTTGLVQWQPIASQTGSNAVTVRVTDVGSLFATQSVSINVAGGAGAVGNWTQVFPANSPPPRAAFAFFPDNTGRGKVVLFGGYTGVVAVGVPTYLNDTWLWDGTNWTQALPANSPSARAFTSADVGPIVTETVLFGGQDATGSPLGDTWKWIGINNEWRQINPPASPPARFGHAMAPGPGGINAVPAPTVLFGGTGAGGVMLGDTWEWGVYQFWTQRTPANSPSRRTGSAMAFDGVRQRVVLFGGRDNNGVVLSDTWLWDGTNWTQATPSTNPPAMIGAKLTSGTTAGTLLLFGLANGVQTWLWNGTNWAQLFPTTTPTPIRWNHGMVYDPANSRIVLFGGMFAGPFYGDTWLWQ